MPFVFEEPLTGPPILKDEVWWAMKIAKENKAMGPDGIPIEALKALEEMGIDLVHLLISCIYETGVVPDEMLKSVFVTLPKNPSATECVSFGTISLISHVLKLLLRIMVQRIEKKAHFLISKEQFGFKPDRGTRNAILCLRVIAERLLNHQQKLFVCFIDFVKAFDKVRHNEVLEALDEAGIDDKDHRLLQNIYWKQKATVRVGFEETGVFDIKIGVRQGCVASAILYNTFSGKIMKSIEEMKGVSIGGMNINNLRFADDTAVIADAEDKLQFLMTTLKDACEKHGMEINTKKNKTEVMVISKEPEKCSIYLNGEKINQTETFTYLGTLITEDGKCTKEIKCRIAQSKSAFTNLKKILTNKKLPFKTRFRVLRCYVWPVLLYACETWTLNLESKKLLESVEMWYLSKMERISYTAHKTNEFVLSKTQKSRMILRDIERRQFKFFGHVIRKCDLEETILSGYINGNRSRGRSRKTYLDDISEKLKRSRTECIRIAKKREEWRRIYMYIKIYIHRIRYK